jgi:hypothetical protein
MHFVVAASAATKLGVVVFPRAERGAKIVMRAFARLLERCRYAALPEILTSSVSRSRQDMLLEVLFQFI